ncbi:MAG: ABC transporter permease [Clostridiaceae bacterium]|jgi:cell division transport system permease protein|nr:ABC transporter permease [Clostridiaceae bacterium]
MRLSTIGNTLREGLRSIVRHPLVTLASISTIALMLILLGAFDIFSLNARQIMAQAGQQPPIEITMELGVSQEKLSAVSKAMDDNPLVLEHILYTPQDNLEQFKESMENKELFEDFPVTNIPHTFSVRLTDPEQSESFRDQIGGMPGVRKVDLELSVMRFLSQAIVWVNYATLVAFIVLGVIAFIIISNMVRVAVFARGEEISIMKYVGATNSYIRVPYIIEGALIGLVGATLAWLLIYIGYNRLYDILMAGIKPTDFLAMVAPEQIARQIILLNLLVGIGVGSLGSAIAVRRHIAV